LRPLFFSGGVMTRSFLLTFQLPKFFFRLLGFPVPSGITEVL